MMSKIEGFKEALSKSKKDLAVEFGVSEIGIFGSYAKGAEKSDSDIDILVEFQRPIGLLKFIELENHLSSLLGAKVDLVSKKALKPRIGERILQGLQKV